MVRWTITAGTAFAVGLAAGVIVGQGLPGSTAVTESQPRNLAITPPKMADAGSSAKPAVPRIKSVVAASEDHSLPGPVKAERLPAADIIIIRSRKQVAPERSQQRATPKPAAIKMARIGNSESALQDNPIVKRELTRDIQRELNRAGCRSVVVSGSWDHRTVKASARFVANSNATLPADRPDVILLGLLRSYEGRACGLSLAATRGDAATTAALTPAAASLLATNPAISGTGPVLSGTGQSFPERDWRLSGSESGKYRQDPLSAAGGPRGRRVGAARDCSGKSEITGAGSYMASRWTEACGTARRPDLVLLRPGGISVRFCVFNTEDLTGRVAIARRAC